MNRSCTRLNQRWIAIAAKDIIDLTPILFNRQSLCSRSTIFKWQRARFCRILTTRTRCRTTKRVSTKWSPAFWQTKKTGCLRRAETQPTRSRCLRSKGKLSCRQCPIIWTHFRRLHKLIWEWAPTVQSPWCSTSSLQRREPPQNQRMELRKLVNRNQSSALTKQLWKG